MRQILEHSVSPDGVYADINAAFDAGTLTSESLTRMCLARIAAFDRKGPSLHAVMTLNPKALEQARALDAERKAKGRRSPLHGIPVVLKDNYDTFDMPTTGGSVLLEGSIPSKDAFVVKKLRDAGAIILAKVNMSEFASGGTYSSLGGQSLNPHDLARGPSGSSGGTGVAIAGGVRADRHGHRTRADRFAGRATTNGIAALKPTHGLLSRIGHHPARAQFRHRRSDGAQRLRRRGRAGDHDRHRSGRLGDRRRATGSFRPITRRTLRATR